jgi:hypothetical protein
MSRLPGALRLLFEVQYVGRMIKAAKRRVTWKFAFVGDADDHSIVLMHTLNSGKKVRHPAAGTAGARAAGREGAGAPSTRMSPLSRSGSAFCGARTRSARPHRELSVPVSLRRSSSSTARRSSRKRRCVRPHATQPRWARATLVFFK